VTVSTAEQIFRSPLNNSKAKFLYSFPKSDRFGYMNKSNSQDKFYVLPEARSHRATSFGFGKKSDFTNTTSNFMPAPGQYTDGLDNMYKFKRTGQKFGPGRAEVKFFDLFKQGETENPPPGHYRPENYRKQNPAAITLKSRIVKPNRGNGVPGPGYYKLASIINGSGNHVDSRYKSHLPTVFSSKVGKDYTDNGVPGPGFYNSNLLLNHNKSILSTKRSVPAFRFNPKVGNIAFRKFSKSPGPAPGDYRLPSEFGYYESKNKSEMASLNNSTDVVSARSSRKRLNMTHS